MGQQGLLRHSLPAFYSAFLGLKEKYTDLSVTHSGAPIWQADQADLSIETQLGIGSRELKI